MTTNKLIKIGLTGGIASGKSTILGYLKEMNIKCIDADKIGHLAYQPDKPSYQLLVEAFGNEIINQTDKSIDRSKLGPIVFSDPLKMKQLTSIVWPEMKKMILNEFKLIEDSNNDGNNSNDQPHDKIVVLEAAVLIEAGFIDCVDQVWVTKVPRSVAISRLKERNNLSESDACKRIDSQLTNEEREKYANLVFDTNADYSETKIKVINEINKLLNK